MVKGLPFEIISKNIVNDALTECSWGYVVRLKPIIYLIGPL